MMKALSIRQPWAWAVAAGFKPVENRGRATPYRGLLAIQAGFVGDPAGFREPLILDAQEEWLDTHPGLDKGYPWSRAGKILAVVHLAGVCDSSYRQAAGEALSVCDCGPWARPRQKHWQFKDPRPLVDPFPWTGALWLQHVHALDEAEILGRTA